MNIWYVNSYPLQKGGKVSPTAMDIAQFLADSAQTGGPRTRAHSSSTDQSSRAHSSGSELEEVSRNDGKYCC